MNQRHHLTQQVRLGLVGLIAATLAGATLGAVPAGATTASHHLGHRSLAAVLAADKGYDHNWNDFDILEKAVTTVLAAKPNSPVQVLADGNTRLTAFIPTDRAFRRLVRDLTGRAPRTERGTFRAITHVANVDTLEAILLYHVVPGVTLTARKVATLNGASVTTAAGPTITVRIHGHTIRLVDQDPDAPNPRVVAVDINKGNKQIAHAINRVLRPIDL
ncbi:hypothetical protein JCM18899A_09260 [Nocardioides sp. AN3]